MSSPGSARRTASSGPSEARRGSTTAAPDTAPVPPCEPPDDGRTQGPGPWRGKQRTRHPPGAGPRQRYGHQQEHRQQRRHEDEHEDEREDEDAGDDPHPRGCDGHRRLEPVPFPNHAPTGRRPAPARRRPVPPHRRQRPDWRALVPGYRTPASTASGASAHLCVPHPAPPHPSPPYSAPTRARHTPVRVPAPHAPVPHHAVRPLDPARRGRRPVESIVLPDGVPPRLIRATHRTKPVKRTPRTASPTGESTARTTHNRPPE